MDSPRVIFAVISDTHFGSSTALALERFVDNDSKTIEASPAQKWILENWRDFWENVKTIAGIQGRKRRHKLVVVHCGDVIDGLHHNSTQALPAVEDQQAMACELLRPLAALADGGYYQLRGTEAHDGSGGQYAAGVAREIGARACDWEMDIEAGGLLYNFTHHGRPGGREWSSGAASQAADIALQRVKDNQPIPRLAFRGHGHTIDDSGEKLEYIRLVHLPSWQLKTAFAHKAAPGKRADIGGVVVDGLQVDFSRARYHAAPGQVARYHV